MDSFRRRLVPSVSVLVAVAALAAGCGDGSLSKSEYVEQNNEIQTSAQAALGDLGTASDPAAVSKQYGAAQKTIDDAAADLKELDPPSDWQDEHDELVATLEDMGELLGDLSTAADEKDFTTLSSAGSELSKLQERASKSIDAMNDDR